MKYVFLLSIIILINGNFLEYELFTMFLDSLYEPKPNKLNDNYAILNITDMTANSLFYILDKNEYSKTIDNSTALPITIDSKGLSQIIPEFTQKFAENTELTVTVYKHEKHDAPILDTSITGTYISFEFGLDIKHGDEVLITSSLSGHLKIQLYTSENKLNVFISNLVVDNIKEIGGSLPIDIEVYKSNTNMVIKIALSQFKEKLKNIELIPIINQKLGTNFTAINISQNKGFITIALN
jgi:hypothetical protein